MPKIILDTNVLVYSYDRRDAAKHQSAKQLLSELHRWQAACFPAQVLAEFMNLAPHKLAMTHSDAYAQVAALSVAWQILNLTPAIVLEAARGVRDHMLPYYDAQIWAAARLNQISVLFSEDFNSGSILEGVRFVNPFATGFRLEEWV